MVAPSLSIGKRGSAAGGGAEKRDHLLGGRWHLEGVPGIGCDQRAKLRHRHHNGPEASSEMRGHRGLALPRERFGLSCRRGEKHVAARKHGLHVHETRCLERGMQFRHLRVEWAHPTEQGRVPPEGFNPCACAPHVCWLCFLGFSLARRGLAGVGVFQRLHIQLHHPHHGLHGPLGAFAVLAAEALNQGLGHHLPGQAVFVL